MIRVALIAYDISPYRGSEAAVSWNFVTAMSRYISLIVYHAGDQQGIDRYTASTPIHNVEWVYIPTPPIAHLAGLRRDYYYMKYYRRWHRTVTDRIRERVAAGDVDLIHYLNPIGFKEPGWSWKISDVPYLWGPIVAVENRPLSLFRAFTTKEKLAAIVRRIVHNSLFVLHPRVRRALSRCDTVFAATPNSRRMLKRYYGIDAAYLPENGIPVMERTTPVSLRSGEQLQIIWVGKVDESRKAIVILLDALLKTTTRRWHLHVVGDGDISDKVKRRIAPVGQQITWHGKVSRADVQTLFMNAHLHVISSLGEATTTVIWEAMSKAIPTMTLDHCGMAGVVCDRCGIKIPIGSYTRVTDRMAHEIDGLITNPERVRTLSEGVLECSRKFMWCNRANLFLDTYKRMLKR